MEIFDKWIYMGGGGGYEIKNMIKVFNTPEKELLGKPIQEVQTGDAVCNYLQAARSVSLLFLIGRVSTFSQHA